MTQFNESRFWQAIDTAHHWKGAHWSEYDPDEQIALLTDHLATWNQEELLQFELTMRQELARLYTAEIIELYTVIWGECTPTKAGYDFDGYVSDDMFLYFRCWMLLQGKAFCDDMRADINRFVSGGYSFDIARCDGEGMLYVTDNAYAATHGDEEDVIRDAAYDAAPELSYDDGDFALAREPLHGSALRARYPQLVAEMGALRTGA